jgi:hypothetical protein
LLAGLSGFGILLNEEKESRDNKNLRLIDFAVFCDKKPIFRLPFHALFSMLFFFFLIGPTTWKPSVRVSSK